MFRSLRIRNYRLWFTGALVSNIGTWMQRTAQSWLVFDELTDHDSTAMGVVMALQFVPQLLLAPYAGVLADRYDRRRILVLTQGIMALLAAALGTLLLLGLAGLSTVYVFALALGVVATFDAPVRQTFVSEMVPDTHLSNAVALNSTSFNSARLIGPAVAGVLVAAVGTGWVFVLNTLTFAAMIWAIVLIDAGRLRPAPRARRGRGQIREGIGYVAHRPDIVAVMATIFMIGTFGMNFAVYLAAMAGSEFGRGSEEFGLLNSMLALGTVTGALLSARRERARLRYIFIGCAAFAVSCLGAATAPSLWLFAVWLIPCGVSSLTIMTTANAYVQSTTAPAMRGRVMSLYMAIFMGGTPIGAPVVGWLTDTFGARWGMGSAVLAGLVGALIGAWFAWRHVPARSGAPTAG
ncbi:MFS transporter [Kocuria rhizophila]|uniref:MFS transporter n=1 Tax=Kocuria rhizophila TaxID=72000 RepID=UPI001EF532C0|nr:MFS transporter [Kocuria rhizophila]MCG7424571.1 MFS transporter [Kocuria rhizophila]MCT1457594.1 MFS transporter [Kocuria rhizophila]MCT1880701.1 MFS transporter [Kocuria rhizophila]MCT2250595.1 MFS transporter [Kocuria rhizophila]